MASRARIERVNARRGLSDRACPRHAHPNVRRPLISTLEPAPTSCPPRSGLARAADQSLPVLPAREPALLWAATSGSTPVPPQSALLGRRPRPGRSGQPEPGRARSRAHPGAVFPLPGRPGLHLRQGLLLFPARRRRAGGHHYDIAAESLDSLAFLPAARSSTAGRARLGGEWIETLMALQGVSSSRQHTAAPSITPSGSWLPRGRRAR